MCGATGNSNDAPVSQPFFNLETCFDFCYFTHYLEYHSLFGMGPKKRSRDEPVASQELLEIRAKKKKLSKWMEGVQRVQSQKHKAQKTNRANTHYVKRPSGVMV